MEHAKAVSHSLTARNHIALLWLVFASSGCAQLHFSADGFRFTASTVSIAAVPLGGNGMTAMPLDLSQMASVGGKERNSPGM